MKFLDKLDRRFGRFAIPNLTVLLIIGQSLTFVLATAKPQFLHDLYFDPRLVLQGEVWRLLTFMIYPPSSTAFLVLIALYVFYLMGTALEAQWGIFRYNVYVFTAYIATVIAATISPFGQTTNIYITTSVFLAFAYLFPNFEFLLFFVLPIKVKYLAMITWAIYAFSLIFAPNWLTRLLIVASVLNFFLFFGRDIVRGVKAYQRRTAYDGKMQRSHEETIHRCTACGMTEKESREAVFRVCSKCSDGQEYCELHIRDHEHV